MFRGYRLGFSLFLMVFLFLVAACGGSSNPAPAESLTITPTVELPVATNIAALPRSVKSAGKAVTEQAANGVDVRIEDFSGNLLGSCTATDANGQCSITITTTQAESGFIIKADGQTVEALDIPTAAEIATGTVSVPVNSETSIAYGSLVAECTGNLAGCTTVDRQNFVDGIIAFVGDDVPEASSAGGYLETLHVAVANAIENNLAGGDLLATALQGDPAGFVAAVGTTVSGVSLSDAVTHGKGTMDMMKDSYFVISSGSTQSVAGGLRTADPTNFNMVALVGIMETFSPTDIANFQPAYFQNFAQQIPNITNGFTAFTHAEAQQAIAEQFKMGAFNNTDRAPVAMGMIFATFPEDMNFGDTFDPPTAGRAAYNGFMQYVDSGGQFTDMNPTTIIQNFRPALGDTTMRQSWATGGSEACSGFIGGFVANPTGFVPGNYTGNIPSPTGGDCTTDSDCVPCNSCSNGTCMVISSKVGSSCTGPDNCDNLTSCMGAFYAGANGACMCTAAMPTGANVYGSGGVPQQYGAAGGYTPAAGSAGMPCTANADCIGGLQCTAGVCMPATFKKGPFSPCAAGAECESGQCTNGQCAMSGAISGGKGVGEACGFPSECAQFCCKAGICAAATGCGGVTPTNMKANGEACATMAECQSGFCCGSPMICKASMAECTGSGGQPAGSYCNTADVCASGLYCNFSLHQCTAY